MRRATVIGAGSWGTALASFLAARGLEVHFWGRDAALMQAIQQSRRNERYLPDLALPAGVRCTHELGSLPASDLVLMVVPSSAMAHTAQLLASTAVAQSQVVVSCTKGIEQSSGKRMSELLGDHFSGPQLAVLSGPNHAEEVARQQPTAAVIAAEQQETALALQEVFTAPWFRSYTSDDVVGVEWAGAMKNPYAIAAGIARGLDLGDNAIAALVTRALAEMTRLGSRAGGKAETFSGLSGVGDLVATCYSLHSRNNRLGIALGQGQSLADYQAKSPMVAEGVPNTRSLYGVAKKLEVRTPVLDAIYGVLHEGKSPTEGLIGLLSREPRAEAE
jgi:glycerol-3-phosphate dehydrogenase (NAD(P)+)